VKIAAVLIVSAAAFAPAAHATSFDGSCDFSGTVRFDPPMTTTPQPVAQSADAPGACSGTLTDRRGRRHTLNAAPTRYQASSSGDAVSCAFGVATGGGRLTFGAATIRFTMTEYRAGATPLIHLQGRRGGEAWMQVTPSQDEDPVAAVQACNAGGLSSFALDGHMQTVGALRG
jgi:hypothetical protein